MSTLNTIKQFSKSSLVAILKLKYKRDIIVRMNYSNYERDIVETYGIVLLNFPGGVVKQPGVLPRPLLQQLVRNIDDREELTRCRWVMLDTTSLTKRKALNAARIANGEEVYKSRRKNVKKLVASTSSSVTGDDDEEE